MSKRKQLKRARHVATPATAPAQPNLPPPAPFSFMGTYDPATGQLTSFNASTPDVPVLYLTEALQKAQLNLVTVVLADREQLRQQMSANSREGN